MPMSPMQDILASLKRGLELIDREYSTAGTLAEVRTLLACCVQQLSLRLALENQQTSAEDMTGLTRQANVGELMGPLSHEFNDFLNAAMLHMMVLELKVPQELRADLVE